MTHLAVGESTKTIYAKGSRADCMRKLQAKYPTFTTRKENSVGRLITNNVLPEPIFIIRNVRVTS